MNEAYMNADMDVVKFSAADVISTSDWAPTYDFTTGPNEGPMDENTGW